MDKKFNDMKRVFVDKADELYEKLPLDKINEKLGGKIDVKNSKVKMGFFAVFVVVLVLIIMLIFSMFNNAPSTSEINSCISRINRFERGELGSNRRCKEITNFEEIDEITPNSSVAKFLGLKQEPCERFKCSIIWKDGSESAGMFLRQGNKFGVFVRDWFE